MKYVLFVIVYVVIDIPVSCMINRWIDKWLLRRAYDKWGVDKYHNMTNKQKDWFETRQTIHECTWDMIVSVILVVMLINLLEFGQ